MENRAKWTNRQKVKMLAETQIVIPAKRSFMESESDALFVKKLSEFASLPVRASDRAAGYDLCS
jgi:hypothetical protein